LTNILASSLGDSEQASHHQQWNNSEPREHEASFTHELLAGAASYEAAKAYEEHEAREGKTHSTHPFSTNCPSTRNSTKKEDPELTMDNRQAP
jgi:hypothetical protein